MNAPFDLQRAAAPALMTSADYRESLRKARPVVYVDGRRVESVADEPAFNPGVQALGVSYDYAHDPALSPLMLANATASGRTVPRMLHVNESAGDLLNKLEAVRVLCQETGCAQRYLAGDALNALAQVCARIDDARGTTEHRARFAAYLDHVQANDLAIGIAMTDAKGDRSKRPHQQGNVDAYVHVVERDGKGVVISGTKAIVTSAPYVHEFLVMPCRNMGEPDADFAICCAVPIDVPGITIIARHGMTRNSCMYGAPVTIAFVPEMTMPRASRSTTCTYASGLACSCGRRERSPLASVIAMPSARSLRWTCSR